MLKNFYFYQWKQILVDLKDVTDLDIYLQESKHLDLHLCAAAQTLTGILARYLVLHKAVVTFLQHNLQVQKKTYVKNIADAVYTRIAEIKTQLQRLECSNNRFFTNGLIIHKLTPLDIEPTEIINYDEVDMRVVVQDVFKQLQRKKEEALLRLEEEKEVEEIDEEFEEENKTETGKLDPASIYAVKKDDPPEVIEMREKINLIKAHEKSRQTTLLINESKMKREIWTKELMGTLHEPAPLEVRKRAATLIKIVMRVYFQSKRDRIADLKRQELVNIRFLKKPPKVISENDEEDIEKIYAVTHTYETEREEVHEQMKVKYLQRKRGDLIDDHKDYLRAWFERWHHELRFFYDIPKKGGSVLILREEVPEPQEWRERYDAYMTEQKEKKNKSKQQLKQEKEEAKKAKKIQKELEKAQKKRQKKKAIPTEYIYPESTAVKEIQKALEAYTREWHEYDFEERADAKIKFVKEKVLSDLLEEVKIQTCFDVDPDMTLELKALWKALKYDYENIYQIPMLEKIGEHVAKDKKKKKEKRPPQPEDPDNANEFLEILADHGLLVQYDQKKFQDFVGDHNFAGNEFRCFNRLAQPFAGEFRQAWMDICQDAKLGFRRILLVGPRGSGRTTMVYLLASTLKAALIQINPEEIQKRELYSAAYLQQLLKPLLICIKTTRPLVIYIKNIQDVFPKKVSKEVKANARMLNENLIKKIFKVNKTDTVTIIASFSEPWACRSGKVLKRFPEVILTPDTTYSAVSLLLKDWVLSNRMIPPDFVTNSLAQTLQGLQYGFLREALDNFLTGDRIIKIAAYGLSVGEVFDYVMNLAAQRIGGARTDYDQYVKWYLDHTSWGKKETAFLEEQKELQEQLRKLEEKKKKKKKVKKVAENFVESPPESVVDED